MTSCFFLSFIQNTRIMVCMSMQHYVWLSEYTEKDIDPYTRLLDQQVPLSYGFVIPSSTLTTLFLPLEVQQKLIPLFELVHAEEQQERSHVVKLISSIIAKSALPAPFLRDIHIAYEQLLERERAYRHLATHDGHRALHIMKHIYAPPVVALSLLPTSFDSTLARGELSLESSLRELIAAYLTRHIGHPLPPSIPSVLVKRVVDAQCVGTCETINRSGNRTDQMVITVHAGAKELEESAHVYLVQKSDAHVIARHFQEQPFKYVLQGTQYKKVAIHPKSATDEILTDSQIQKIVYCAKDFEREVYFPQKIHFAFEKGELFIERIRPL